MRIISIFVLSVLVAACGKPSEAPDVQMVAQDTSKTPTPADVAPENATLASDVSTDISEPPPEPRAIAPMFESWSQGRLEQAFAAVTDDADWHVVGHPETPHLKGRAALVAFEKARHASHTSLSMKVKRIMATAEAQVIEYVWTAMVEVRGPDGTETRREVTVPAALVLIYDSADKIIEGWSFQNDAIVLQQVGVMAGLPEGFVPFPEPEGLEVVNGDTNPTVAETWKTVVERLDTNRISDIKDLLADDFRGMGHRSGASLEKAAMMALFEGRLKTIGEPARTTVRDFAVGEYHASISTTAGTYLGGLGPEPKGQRIALTTLDVVRVVNGKLASFSTYQNDLEPLATLGLLGTPAPEPRADDNAPHCDRFMRAMKLCLESMPEAARKPQQDTLERLVESWKTMTDKAALDGSCKTLIDNSRPGLAKVCPDVKWD